MCVFYNPRITLRRMCPNNVKAYFVCMQVKKLQLESNMEQQMVLNLGKEYVKAIYFHPTYLTYMQSTSCEMPGWMKHKLELRLPGEYQ